MDETIRKNFPNDDRDIWILKKVENKFISFLLPRLPSYIKTNHLTLMTIFWSLGVIMSNYLASYHIGWLTLTSFLVICQLITDMLDGSLGRARNSGLVKWGYYMDHFLDYIFLSSLLYSYTFILPDLVRLLFLTHIVLTATMIHSFLYFGISGKLIRSFYKIGSTELRFICLLLNLYLIFDGTRIAQILMIFILIIFLVLAKIIYTTQKEARDIDMEPSEKIF